MELIPPPPDKLCPLCGGALKSDCAQCPKCGDPTQKMIDHPKSEVNPQFSPPTPEDRLGFAVLLFFSILISVHRYKTTFYSLRDDERFDDSFFITCVIFGALWGLPLMWVVGKWREAITLGVKNHSHLIRPFWQLQLIMFLLSMALMLLLVVNCQTF